MENGNAKSTGELSRPLNPKEYRALAHRMVDFIADYYEKIESFPVRSQVEPGYLKALLPDRAPDNAESLEAILDDVTSKIMPGVTHWQSPNFFAYFSANSSTPGLLGDMLDSALNTIAFSWISSPAATELEVLVLDWIANAMNLDKGFVSPFNGGTGGGVIQGTASESVVVSLLAAISKKTKEAEGGGSIRDRLIGYSSDQAHSCVQKAFMVSGLLPSQLRVLPTLPSDQFSLSPKALEVAIEADRREGKVPFFLCATVGTTSSATVDPLKSLGAISQRFGLWMHVDAAYAGPTLLCEEFSQHFDGLDLASSFCFNAHKWMLTNFDCSCLYVKEPQCLKDALTIQPEFLRNKASDSMDVIDYKDWQIPLGRTFRSLKLWFVLRMFGVCGIKKYLREHVSMAEMFESLVQSDARFEVTAPRHFSLVCFRLRPLRAKEGGGERGDEMREEKGSGKGDNGKALNASLLEDINQCGDIFLTHTVLGGVFTLRFAIGGAQTQKYHVINAWETIKRHADKLWPAAHVPA